MFNAQQARQNAYAVNSTSHSQQLVGALIAQIKQYSDAGKFGMTEQMTMRQANELERLGYIVERSSWWHGDNTYHVSW